MPINHLRLHSSPAWLRLARHEQQLLHIPQAPIAPTLWISADASWSAQHAATPLLTRLHPDGAGLCGDVVCEASRLPFDSDSTQTIIVQHAADVLPRIESLLAELCRVLAPGGQMFWFGLNPASAWCSWSHWRTSSRQSLHPRWKFQIDQLLAKHRVDAVDSRYLGGLWPQSRGINEARRMYLLDGLRGAWLLSARKRRAVLTPLRPRQRSSKLQHRPLTVVPSTRVRP